MNINTAAEDKATVFILFIYSHYIKKYIDMTQVICYT